MIVQISRFCGNWCLLFPLAELLFFKVEVFVECQKIFWETTTLDLSYVVLVKSTVEISQNFVAFSEYMNITKVDILVPDCSHITFE